MPDWITMQQTADKIGVRKGTLCMWRNRKKFPFKTKGAGRGLMVSGASVNEWMEKNKGKAVQGAKKPAKAAKKKAGRPAGTKKVGRPAKKKVGRPAKKAVGRPAKRKPGRPAKKAVGRPAKKKAGRPRKTAGRPPKAKAAAGACEIVVQGSLDLGVIQTFVDNLRAGHKLQIAPSPSGYVLSTVAQ